MIFSRHWWAVAVATTLGCEFANAQSPASRTAVWTGNEMLVWGGTDFATVGGAVMTDPGWRYESANDSWLPIPAAGAPRARVWHTAVWTGSEMIIWGGQGTNFLQDGARFRPTLNSWLATPAVNAPDTRASHTAVWTGNEMIIWGGYRGSGPVTHLNTGGRFEPGANNWIAVTDNAAPAVRSYHSAVWTGSEMIVWGGYNSIFLNSGGRYSPVTNSWSAVSTTGAPSARYAHTAVWTGDEMIVWGGYNGSVPSSGGRYRPKSNSWTNMTTTAAPEPRYLHTAVWTGTEMIIWGGYNSDYELNSGARYNPAVNAWFPVTTSNAPVARYYHTAVWTGTEMIVWGGYNGNRLTDGARYNPTTDTWTPICPGFPDSFACRAMISGDNVSITASSAAATKEPGEPNHGRNPGGKSLWWSWTAPHSGGVAITTAGSDFDTLLAVYMGTNLSALTTVASDGRTNVPGAVTFSATAGVEYQIAVDGNDGAAGDILLSLVLSAQPANDNFVNRINIPGGGVAVGHNLGATKETGETNHAQAVGGKSVWWTWTAPSDSCVTVTTAGSGFDTLLHVYTNATLASLVSVAANDDATGDVTSSVSFKAIAGLTYQIAVDGFNGASGNILLQVIPFAGPLNDAFASPTTLTGTNFNLTLSNIWGSVEANEPDLGGGPGAKTLWWQWTPATAGGATIDLRGSDYSTRAAVYSGSSVDALTTIASGEDYLVFKALGGTTYRIVVNVGGEFSDPAAAKLKFKLTFAPSPANDNFANSTSLGTNTGVNTTGSNIGATTEPSEPPHQNAFVPAQSVSGKTVWWTWATPNYQSARVTVRSSNFLSAVTIYTGSTLTNLTRIGGRVGINPTNEVTFYALANTNYRIAVDAVGGAEGNFEFAVGNVFAATNDEFADRITLSGTNVSTVGWNTDASREDFEKNHAGVPGVASVWWSWTAPTQGRLFLTTSGSTYSPLLGVYRGTEVLFLTSAANVVYLGQGCPRFIFANLDVAAGQTYQIAVDGESGSPTPVGGIDLTLAFVPKPANDDFAARTLLTGSSLVVTGSVIAASQQPTEVVAGNASGLRTVWYSWTAPHDIGGTSGSVTLRVSGIDLPPDQPLVQVYQGSSVSGLTNVAVESALWGNLRQVTFPAQAGTTYQIVVAGDQSFGGWLNDSFAKRRGNIPPDPLAESGSFVLRLNYSTLALRIRNTIPASVPIPGQNGWGEKVPFAAEAEVINYGQNSSNPVRVRLLAMTSKGRTLGDEGVFTPLFSAGVLPGGIAAMPIYGGSPFRGSVLAVLEEQVGGDWFIRDTGVVIVGFVSQEFLCSIITGGGVALLEPGIGGAQCFCPPLLTSVQINGPASVTEGGATAYWGTAVFNNGSTPNFTNTLWTTSNTNQFPITTNGLLTAGSVTTDTAISVNTRFSYLGIEQSTNKPVTILNLPPPALANLLRLPNGDFQLALQGVPNRQHVVEATTNLAAPIQWTSLTTNAADSGGAFQFTDTQATNFLQRYYRAREN